MLGRFSKVQAPTFRIDFSSTSSHVLTEDIRLLDDSRAYNKMLIISRWLAFQQHTFVPVFDGPQPTKWLLSTSLVALLADVRMAHSSHSKEYQPGRGPGNLNFSSSSTALTISDNLVHHEIATWHLSRNPRLVAHGLPLAPTCCSLYSPYACSSKSYVCSPSHPPPRSTIWHTLSMTLHPKTPPCTRT